MTHTDKMPLSYLLKQLTAYYLRNGEVFLEGPIFLEMFNQDRALKLSYMTSPELEDQLRITP